MLTRNILFKNFNNKNKKKNIKILLKNLLLENNQILQSFKKTYKDSFNKKFLIRLKKYPQIVLIGMGGSILGARSIFNFLNYKIKKFFLFYDDFGKKNEKITKRKNLNLIISKSGNTLETIVNVNTLITGRDKNVFITENKKSYLMKLANQIKADVIHHNNFIGGRYSVLSEVGMVPAALMGLNINKFRRFNSLIKNKNFMNSLIINVSNMLNFLNKKKSNSIILNYDERSSDLFLWYQQLVAESLGKKGKGLLPIISKMPKDNHSLMQLYLDGPRNNFFTFFFVNEDNSTKIKNHNLNSSHFYLKNKKVNEIKYSQFLATENVFKKKNIPFRSFLIKKRNEETLGELFTFFMLETILLGKAINVNPYTQPSVELIKNDTKKFLKKN
tara:strand:+ start:218 stop:1378 length:1161 start_codon:yes stop_codon:yes gene_type:complete